MSLIYKLKAMSPMNAVKTMKQLLLDSINYLEGKIAHETKILQIKQYILLKQIRRYKSKNTKACQPEKARDRRSVLVYNIKKEAKAEDLYKYLEECGQIEDIVMPLKNGRFVGRARVIFKHEVHAFISLRMHKTCFMGHKIRVLPFNLNFKLEIIQAIVRAWGDTMLQRYPVTSSIRQRLRVRAAAAAHREELIGFYRQVTKIGANSEIIAIYSLLDLSYDSLRLEGRYPISKVECDEKLAGNPFTDFN